MQCRSFARAIVGVVVLALLVACSGASSKTQRNPHSAVPIDVHKIQHVIVIMQENRSFDRHFGTYPGADGIPSTLGLRTPCLADHRIGKCE
jgi:phospholipase C